MQYIHYDNQWQQTCGFKQQLDGLGMMKYKYRPKADPQTMKDGVPITSIHLKL